jgi:2-amino-4-hydroxy-6-hydroxymethyldihydropteridine diphosphokinase
LAVIYLGLGSNLGDRKANIKWALAALETIGIQIEKCSSFMETEAVGGPKQGKFLNAVLKAHTELRPEELFVRIKLIEKKLGRTPTVKNGPRPIDIDILLYNHENINKPYLVIPHPRMLQRDFVMRPLKEIEPELGNQLEHSSPEHY